MTFLPENIKSLYNLSWLNLSYNSLPSLPSGLVLLSSLTTLLLNNLYLTELPDDLGLLTQLETLELREACDQLCTTCMQVSGRS